MSKDSQFQDDRQANKQNNRVFGQSTCSEMLGLPFASTWWIAVREYDRLSSAAQDSLRAGDL
jgi:hypothetical protein